MNPTTITFLTDDDCHRLLQASEANPDLHDVVQLMLATGLRPSELERLRYQDIDYSQGTITAKGKSGPRSVLLDDKTMGMLRSRLDRQLVFGTGRHSTLHRVRLQLRAVAATLGLNVRNFHTLRASWAHRLANAGLNPSELASHLQRTN